MNNIEKNLLEVFEKFFYNDNLSEFVEEMTVKYNKVIQNGVKEGMTLDTNSERDLLHRMLIEYVPRIISQKLKESLKAYEESISEQPLLLAHPSGVINKDIFNMIPSFVVK